MICAQIYDASKQQHLSSYRSLVEQLDSYDKQNKPVGDTDLSPATTRKITGNNSIMGVTPPLCVYNYV